MAFNFCGVFKGKDDKLPWRCEIRSLNESLGGTPSTFSLEMKKKDKKY